MFGVPAHVGKGGNAKKRKAVTSDDAYRGVHIVQPRKSTWLVPVALRASAVGTPDNRSCVTRSPSGRA